MSKGLFLILLLFISSCFDNNDKYLKFYNSHFYELMKEDSVDCTYLIIPSTSCMTCNTYVDEVAKQLISIPQIKIIYECNPSDYLLLIRKLHENKIFLTESLFIDTLQKYQLPSQDINAQNTIVITIKNSSVSDFEFLNSRNPEVLNELIDNFRKLDSYN